MNARRSATNVRECFFKTDLNIAIKMNDERNIEKHILDTMAFDTIEMVEADMNPIIDAIRGLFIIFNYRL